MSKATYTHNRNNTNSHGKNLHTSFPDDEKTKIGIELE